LERNTKKSNPNLAKRKAKIATKAVDQETRLRKNIDLLIYDCLHYGHEQEEVKNFTGNTQCRAFSITSEERIPGKRTANMSRENSGGGKITGIFRCGTVGEKM